ncbi:P-loop containing nucleoside triphosphate hydrolase [Vibrio phage 1.111.B._10N.286.45.E6]|nr:P-loop containing nucleoside triphosphate hydrolase [Vibrio phage 1.111.A._10N.286.45.E6]AUR88299.1 P-loop containing nucleoside triphosphate hydrolase [Vibrio phage 1.111.B._10N.286.45.E6]
MQNFTSNNEGAYNPRDYQIEGLNLITEHLQRAFATGECVPAFVEYSVGYGKTGIYAFLARHVTRNNPARKAAGKRPFRVLIIAHQTELTKQNSEFAYRAGVYNSVVASELNAGKHPKNMDLRNVVFANEKTLVNRINDPESMMFDDWTPDLICIDENHRVDWQNFIKFEKGHNNEDEKPTAYTQILRYFLARNKNIQLIGGSGSPWRNNEWIKGSFWKECIDRKDTADLIKSGALAPVQWGAHEAGYDYSGLDYELDDTGDRDIDLKAAEKITSSQLTTTESICREVVKLSEERNACLVFCSGQDHLKEVKAALVDAGVDDNQIGVITESTGYATRTDILNRARKGECKYVLNVSVLTTGVNVPLWDMLVFMRPVGSVVLFTQAVGRVLRTHDDDVRELGYPEKKNALVLDYAGVYERLGHLAESLSDDETEYEHKEKKKQLKACAKCGVDMSYHAAICGGCGHDHGEAKICRGSGRNVGCGHASKSTARRCEKCHTPLKDVNENLSNKHYRKHEFEEVSSMGFGQPTAA